MKRFLPVIKLILGWPLSLVAVFFVANIFISKFPEISPNIKEVNALVFIYALVSFQLYYFLKSYVWKMILKEKGIDVPFKDSCFLWAISEFKRFVPGNIWSFLGRASAFSSKGAKGKDIALSLIYEAQFFVVASLIVSVFSFSFLSKTLFPNYALPDSLFILPLIFSALFVYSKKISLSLISRIFPPFQAEKSIKILSISILYMSFFSLGTYFSISSMIYLPLEGFLTIISLFSISILIGYLSLITPMGLGVREGVLTFGLSKFIPVGLAAFASVFSRIILIISELLFIAISYLWYKTSNSFILKIENIFKKNTYECILAFLIILYFLYFTSLSFLRHDNFYTGRFDLGNMVQTVWNTSEGRIFMFTNPNGTEAVSRLAFHADFFLVLLAPFYRIWSDPKLLLLIQTTVIALGAIFVYLLAKEFLKEKSLALLFSFLYLINPSVQYANLYDFHAVSMAPAFIFGALYFLARKKYLLFLLFSFLSAITKEQIWLVIALLGIFMFFPVGKKEQKGNILKGAAIFLISIFIFYLLLWKAIPYARGGENHFALEYYSGFGDSPSSIIKNIFFSPQKTLSTVLLPDRLDYLKQLFFPFGYISLISPAFLVFASPDLFINLLSSNNQLHQIYYQYSSVITTFVILSAIFGLAKIKKHFSFIPNYMFILYLLAVSLQSAYSFGPMAGAKKPNIDMLSKQNQDSKAIRDMLEQIPQNYSVASSNNMGAHLSEREKIFTIPVGTDKAEIIVFMLNDPFAQPSLEAQKAMAENMERDSNYEMMYKKGDFVLFKKNGVDFTLKN